MMTRRNATSKLIWTAMVGSMLVVPLLISASIAQPRGGRGSRGRHGGDPSRAFLRELDLTEEQRQQMHTLAEPSSRETFERATQMRNALNEAIENGEDEGALRQHAYELGMAEGDAAVERARTHAQMIRVRLFWNGGFGMSHSGKGSSHLTRLRWRPLTGTTLPSA